MIGGPTGNLAGSEQQKISFLTGYRCTLVIVEACKIIIIFVFGTISNSLKISNYVSLGEFLIEFT